MTKVLAEVTGSISFSQKGDKGQKGALAREHDDFESGSYKYLSGAGEETYVDVVCVKGKWYQCTKTYDNATSSPNLIDGHWTEMSNYKSIATHLLLAENATINMLGSNQINLYNPSGGAMFGSFRVVSDDNDDNDYALWLGAPNGADAPFSVKRSGFTKMTDADVTGKITATSGQIAGMKIKGLALTNEDLNNDAYIILQNNKRNTYVGIGGNVASVSTGLRAVAMFSNGEKRSMYNQNFAMVVGASGAGTNIAIDITGGFVSGLRIRTEYLTSGGGNINTPKKIPKGVNSVILAGAGYYEFPAMEQNDDGYVIFVKNDYDGSVNIGAAQGVTVDGSSKNTFILYNQGSMSTNLTIESRGDAMVFVYHRDVSRPNISSESGCWVQYKCPRDW